MGEPDHRAGVVALLGLPNAGKSTLLNRLLGEDLAIVTRKPQTTRSRILGVLTRPGAQLLLYDTPGLQRGSDALSGSMREAVDAVARDCDVALVLLDPARGWRPAHGDLLERVSAGGGQPLLVGTHVDVPEAAAAPWPPEPAGGIPAFRVSGRTGTGVEALLDAVVARLPAAPPFYAEDALTDRPLRFMVAERVREAAYQELSQELPYAVAVEVRAFDGSRKDRVHIEADLIVERATQKRIAIGAGGRMVKAIGTRARRAIEPLVGRPVHLALFVKVEPHWARHARRVRALGYE